MRFVLVGPAPPYRGGIAQYTRSLCEALEKDHRALVISFRRQYPAFFFPGKTQREVGGDVWQGPVERLLDSVNPVSWSRCAGRIREFRPDAVIFQWWHPFFGPAFGAIARRLKRRPQIPVFFLCHNVYPHERLQLPGGATLENWLIRRAFRWVDGFLVHSTRLEKEIRNLNGGARVRRIFHPVQDFYSAWDTGPLPDGKGAARLLFFGKVRRYKGLDVFLEALDRIGSRLDFRATIAGEFYVDVKPYRRLADRPNLRDRLVWLDRYIENRSVPELFRNADLVVLPYREATQSGVVPLAYHFAVPVIASDVGGLSEIVIDGQTGYLVAPGDADVLADRIVEYFEKGKKGEFQQNIRAFRRRLSWGQVVDNILELLPPPAQGAAL